MPIFFLTPNFFTPIFLHYPKKFSTPFFYPLFFNSIFLPPKLFHPHFLHPLFLECRKFGKSKNGNPEVQKFGKLEIRKFGKSEIWKFGKSENRRFRNTEIREIGKSERKGILNNKRITGMSVSCFFTHTSGFPGLLATFISKIRNYKTLYYI